ncbi:deoxynucleoside kinase [Patescibacteria group bacterium]|nr:deoxynucleoside kinase [Patescibacteria group bacterium]
MSDKFFWICIEGIDATGKTTMSKQITKLLKQKYGHNYQIILLNEFSNYQTGKLIKQELNKKFFFYLGENEHYPLAEILLLESDFILQFEVIFSKKNNRKKIIISDRGPLTFFIYQKSRLSNKYINIKWDNWIKNNLSYIIGEPDLYIILDCDVEEIKQRILKRDKRLLTNKEIIQIKQYQRQYKKFVNKFANKQNVIFLDKHPKDIYSTFSYITREIEKEKALS